MAQLEIKKSVVCILDAQDITLAELTEAVTDLGRVCPQNTVLTISAKPNHKDRKSWISISGTW